MNVCDPAEINVTQFRQLEHDYIGYQSLTDVPRALAYPEVTGNSLVNKDLIKILYFGNLFKCFI